MILLVYVSSRLIAKNDRPQVHVVTVEELWTFRETLMLLKPLSRMRLKVLDILSGRQSLLSSQYVSHKPCHKCDVTCLGNWTANFKICKVLLIQTLGILLKLKGSCGCFLIYIRPLTYKAGELCNQKKL